MKYTITVRKTMYNALTSCLIKLKNEVFLALELKTIFDKLHSFI